MALKVPPFLSSPGIPDPPFWDKIKSKKFIFVMLWTAFVVWGFIVMFWTRAEVAWFKKLLEYGFWINSLYVVAQGIQDLPKADENLTLSSRKVIVVGLQVFFLLAGFVLSFYLMKTTGNGDLTFLNDLITGAGSAVIALIGVGFTIQQGKLTQGTPDTVVAPTQEKKP